MKLSMSIIADYIEEIPVFETYGDNWDEFELSGWELYLDQSIKEDILYVTDGDGVTSLINEKDAYIICSGEKPEGFMGRGIFTDVPLKVIINAVSKVFTRFSDLEKKLQEAALIHRDMQMLVDIMGPYFKDALSICTLDFQRIGYTEGSMRVLSDSELPGMDARGELPSEVVNYFKNDINFARVRMLREPFIYEKSIFLCDALCQNVFYRGEPVCRAVHYSFDGGFRGYDRGLIKFFASYVQMVYEYSGEKESYVPRNHLQEVALGILRNEQMPEGRVKLALMSRGWPVDGPFLCVCLLPSDRDIFNHTISYFCKSIGKELRGSCVFEYEDHIACIVDLTEYDGSTDGFMKSTVEYFRDNHFLAGFSEVFYDMKKLGNFWRQASIALQSGLRAAPTIWYHKFSDRAFSYMLDKMTEELDAESICAPQIIALKKYDIENGTDYFNTLKVYLRSGMNAVQTANTLYIHRGTMMYRLKRLQEMLGISLDEYKNRLYLELSYEILEQNDVM